jgi:tRNA A-37 threonylcarbamoyl transferase component Bud32
VWSASFDGTPAVVKQAVGGADVGERFAREVTALRLAARADPQLAPRVLGADESARIMVLEHLPVRERVFADWVAYATGLAHLHAVTTSADAGVLPPATGPTNDDVAAFLRLCAEFDLVSPAAEQELEALLHRLSVGGTQLVHGDPCVGNALPIDGRAWFIDFEHAALGNGLTELAYLRIGFPTCWNVSAVPDHLLDEAEAAYREVWPNLPGSISDHCVGWLLRGDALVQRAHRDGRDHLARLVEKDWKWGFVGARQRVVHRLGVVAKLPEFDAVGSLAAALRARMIARWPDAAAPPVSPVQTAD